MKLGRSFILLLVIPLIALCGLVFRHKFTSRPVTLSSSPSSVGDSGKWSHLNYATINLTENFRDKLRNTISRESAKFADWPVARTEKIVDFLCAYLEAYHNGNFEIYWRFRAPTGKTSISNETAVKLRKFINDQQQNANIQLISSVALEKITNPRDLMELTWRVMDFPREHYGIKVTGCKSCYDSVALDDIRLTLVPHTKLEVIELRERLVSQITKHPRRGFVLQEGYVRSQPDYDEEQRRDPAKFHFISAMLPIKLASGYTLSTYVFTFWSESEGRFLPYAHGLGDSSAQAPRVLF